MDWRWWLRRTNVLLPVEIRQRECAKNPRFARVIGPINWWYNYTILPYWLFNNFKKSLQPFDQIQLLSRTFLASIENSLSFISRLANSGWLQYIGDTLTGSATVAQLIHCMNEGTGGMRKIHHVTIPHNCKNAQHLLFNWVDSWASSFLIYLSLYFYFFLYMRWDL
jgi:hypothetical protein